MENRDRKSALFEAIAVMGKAFASPVRLELLDLLAQAPRNVDELARASGQSTANASQHLQALYAAGLVARSREGTSVRYSLAGDDALKLWLALRATSCWSTCGPRTSSPPATSRARARSRSRSWSAGWPSSPRTARSSPTAAA